MISALAFIPISEVEKGFELLVKEICHVLDKREAGNCNLEKTDQLRSYFQRTYLKGGKIGRNKKDAILPKEPWNQSQETSEGLIRTINAV